MTIRAVTWDDARTMLSRSRANLFGVPAGASATGTGGGSKGGQTVVAGPGIAAVSSPGGTVAGGGPVSGPAGLATARQPVATAPGAGAKGAPTGVVSAGGAVSAPRPTTPQPGEAWGEVPPSQPVALAFMVLNALRDAGVNPFDPPGWPGGSSQGVLRFGLGPRAPRCLCRAGQATQVQVVFNATGIIVPSMSQAFPFTASDAGAASMSPNAGSIGWSTAGAPGGASARSFTWLTDTGWYEEAVQMLNGNATAGGIVLAGATRR